MTLAILDARDKEYVLVAAGAGLIASYVQQAIAAGQTAQEVLDAILAAGLSEGVFPSLAAGESGTTDGQYFWVGDAGTVVLYRNDAGVGTEIAELATAASLAGKVDTAALGSPAGGAMVGFKQDGAGAVDRDMLAKAKEMLSTTDMDAAIDGTTDDSDALIATFAQMAITGRANLLSGTYKVTKPLIIPPGVIEGGNVVLDFSGADLADFPDGRCITFLGAAPSQIANIDTDMAFGDRTFSFAAAHGLLQDESYQLCGTVDYAGNGGRAYYRKGEIFRVASVGDATTLASEMAARDTYAAADVEVWKRSGDRFTQGCASLTIIGPDTIDYVAAFANLDRTIIDNLRAVGGKFGSIWIGNCYQVTGKNVDARQTSSAGGGNQNYGIVISNCQDVRINGRAYGYFVGFTVGGSGGAGKYIMNRDIHFEGPVGSDPTGGLAGFGLHGNSEYCSYRGVATNGVVLAGNKSEAHGEFIKARGFSPVQVSEMHGADFTVTGTLRSSGADLPSTQGAVTQTGMGEYLRYGGRSLFDLKIYAPNAKGLFLWRSTGLARSDVVLDLRLDIMEAHATQRVINLNKNSGGDIPLVEVNRLRVIDNAVAITWSLNAATAVKGMRDEQRVTVTGTGASSYTQAVTFPVTFPRAPIVWPALASQIVGGTARQVVGLSGSPTATGCTVQLGSVDGTNQNANAAVSVVAMSQ
jgi:hypothetical protein